MNNIFVKNGKSIFATCLMLILVLFGVMCLQRRGDVQKDGGKRPLRIGMMSGWPPYMSIDARGNYVGFDVDFARLLGTQLGREVEIIDGGSLSTLFLSLETGKIDLIFSGLDITQERCKRMNMVPYTGENILYLCAIFSGQVPQGVTSFANLGQLTNGAVVCVEANSASEELLAFYPAITKKQLKGMADMVLEVRTGKAMAFLAEPQVARRLLQKDPGLVSLKVPLPNELKMYGCGIAIKKANKPLTDAVTRAVAEFRRTGELERLKKQWNLKGE